VWPTHFSSKIICSNKFVRINLFENNLFENNLFENNLFKNNLF
jgi:hypothetical protein